MIEADEQGGEPATSVQDLRDLGRLFGNGLSVPLTSVPKRLGLDADAAAVRVAELEAASLVEVWATDPSGASLVLAPLGRSGLDCWDEAASRTRGMRTFSELEASDRSPFEIADPAPSPLAQLVNREIDDIIGIESARRVVPICGLSAPWGAAERARHRWARPRRYHPRAKAPDPCPACSGRKFEPQHVCLVCSRVGRSDASRPGPDPEPVVENIPARFQPRSRGARREERTGA